MSRSLRNGFSIWAGSSSSAMARCSHARVPPRRRACAGILLHHSRSRPSKAFFPVCTLCRNCSKISTAAEDNGTIAVRTRQFPHSHCRGSRFASGQY
jgi:hypothetical protein